MSFITRCPACGTAFRVVSDQLKISEGWVRCGRCQHIFDATLDLLPGWPSADGVERSNEPQPGTAHIEVPVEAFPELPDTVLAESDLRSELGADVPEAPAPEPEPLGSFESLALPEPENTGLAWTADPPPFSSAEAASDPAEVWQAAPETLSFVRHAQRRAFWRRSAVRWVLAVLVLLLSVTLVLQLLVSMRDEVLARVPVLEPVLRLICQPLGCDVSGVRQIEALSIDSSALLRKTPERFAFDMVLKNASQRTLLPPALELTLTDVQDHVVIRRVFTPQEWPQPKTQLTPSSEWPVRFELELASATAMPVVGYRAVLFYP